ncbi:MAG: hypothetical protein RL585_239 [Pseudomonadota bacterium]|jgi:oxygen-independent coproporphyrinogen-3 oxidase
MAESLKAITEISLVRHDEIRLPFPPPLGLYIHMPWCVRKCPYCDFNSHEAANLSTTNGRVNLQNTDSLFAPYIDALICDLEGSLASVWGRNVQTVFIGGGTPSLCPPPLMAKLLDAVRSLLRLSADAEITMEANPGSFERERFEAFAATGVNRLSLGVQSFSDDCLRRIGRIHDGSQSHFALDAAIRIFPRVNIDLMYGQPGQDLASLGSDLAAALHYVDKGLSHLSLYQFTIEPNTVFAKHAPACMPDEDLLESMQWLIESNLAHAGFEQYEVSAWAQTGQRCRHNLNYWQFGDYLGIGAGAHGKISDHQGIRRTVRRRNPELYMDSLMPESGKQHYTERWLAPSDLPFEFMLNVLRLKDGVPSHWWQERTGLPATVLAQMANQAVSKGLLDQNPTHWRASDLGWRFLNDLQASFLRDTP